MVNCKKMEFAKSSVLTAQEEPVLEVGLPGSPSRHAHHLGSVEAWNVSKGYHGATGTFQALSPTFELELLEFHHAI